MYCTPIRTTSKWSKWLIVKAVLKGGGVCVCMGGGGGGGGGGGVPLHHFHPPLTFPSFTLYIELDTPNSPPH